MLSWGTFSARRAALAALPYLGIAALACAVALSLHPAQSGRPDSATYLNAAVHLAHGHGYVTSTVAMGGTSPSPITLFPPGFSALMLPFLAFGMAPLAAAAWAQVASFVLFALAASWLLSNVTESPLGALWALPLVFAPGLLSELDFLLSDVLGAALAVLGAALLVRTDKPCLWSRLALGAVLGLSILTRWALAFSVLAIALAALVTWNRALPFKRRVALLWPLAVVPALFVVPLFLRNLLVGGGLMGRRPLVSNDFWEQLLDAFAGLVESLLGTPLHAGPVLALLLLALAIVPFVVPRLAAAWRARALIIVTLGYFALMTVIGTVQHFDPLSGPRFWLPLPPVIVGALVAVLAALPHEHRVRTVALSGFALAFGVLGVVWARDYTREVPRADKRHGYLEGKVGRSALGRDALRMAAAHDCRLASNVPRRLIPDAGIELVGTFTKKTEPTERALEKHGKHCLVFFTQDLPGSPRKALRENRAFLKALREAQRAERVTTDSSAELWVLSPKR